MKKYFFIFILVVMPLPSFAEADLKNALANLTVKLQTLAQQISPPTTIAEEAKRLAREANELRLQIEDKIHSIIQKARDKIVALQELIKPQTILDQLKAVKYGKDSQVQILDSQKDGLKFGWGYTGYGDLLEGFKGFSAQLIITDVPGFFQDAVKKTLSAIGFDKILTFSPAQEWLWQVVLLSKDYKDFSSKILFAFQFNMLLLRLVNTKDAQGEPKYKNFKNVTDDISSIITKLLELISQALSKMVKFNEALILGDPSADTKTSQSIGNFLETYYKKFVELTNQEFKMTLRDGKFVKNPKYAPSTTKISNAEAREQLLAITLKTMIFYSALSDLFNATPTGKSAKQELEEARAAKTEDALNEYNKKLPGYEDLKVFVGISLLRLLGQMQDKTYQHILEKVFDPVTNLLGLPSFDALLKFVGDKEKVELPPPPPPAPEVETGPVFSTDKPVSQDAWEAAYKKQEEEEKEDQPEKAPVPDWAKSDSDSDW